MTAEEYLLGRFGPLMSMACSGQLIPDTALSFSSATAGASPLLN
jgi:hypothetical protein